jgi:cobalt-zinc-cadmium efflux system outer membrane protein
MKSYSILSFFLGATMALHSAELRLTIEQAADYARRHNPSLAAARLRIDEARGRLRNAGRWKNPEVEVEAARNPRSPEGSWSLAFMQKFPLTDRLRLEKAISAAELDAAGAEVENEARKLAGEVRRVAVQMLALREQRGLGERRRDNSKELAGFLTKRVEAGEAAVLDAEQVQLETAQLETELLQLDADRARLLAELRPLLGASSSVEIAGRLPAPADLPAKGVRTSARADFLAAQAQTAAAERGVDLARAGKWEDLGVGLMLSHERSEDAPEGFRRDTFLGLKFSLPLPLWNKNEGKIEEAIATAARSRKEAEAIAFNIRAETTGARDEMALLAKLFAKLDTDLLPAATRLEDQFRSSYATGLVPLPEVLRARTRRLDLERQRLDVLRDYHLARERHRTAAATTTIPSPSFK